MSRGTAEKVEVSVTYKHQTDRAVLVNDGEYDFWLPKSQVTIEGGEFPDEAGTAIEIELPEWLAKEKGLI